MSANAASACQEEPYPTEPEATEVAAPLFDASGPTDLPENLAPDPLPEATVAPLDFARTLSTENATVGTITPEQVRDYLVASALAVATRDARVPG